ncbi:MAG: hypothetical protein GEU90_18010 [Gemmatimonas sp.]|nr:hypothetical protein [Gemmatimonas sp.]
MTSARSGRSIAVSLTLLGLIALGITGPVTPTAAQVNAVDERLHLFDAAEFGIDPAEVTYARDIAPILQRSCLTCHRPNGAAPMAFSSYEEVKPWAPVMKLRTAIRDRMGAMPPWYVEKDIGIQHFKNDPSLSDRELALIQAWADNGAPLGDPADLPPAPDFAETDGWSIDPDIVVSSEEMLVEGGAPDWWGEIESIPIPLESDRYVRALEVREVNDVPTEGTGRQTVGGRWIFHHLIYRTEVPGEDEESATGWPVHEVGRNPDFFDPDAAPLLRAGSHITSESAHLHSTGLDTTGRLEFGFELYPEDYEPKYKRARFSLGDGLNISIAPTADGQELHAYEVLKQHTKIISFEPHLHAPGDRMCLEAIWDRHIETLSCVGYDHNWVRTYFFADDYQPLLPEGAVLHITGFMNNTETNPNIPDPRNWQGSGNRSVANMFIDLGLRVGLTDEQFINEMVERRASLDIGPNDHVIGCPLCLAAIPSVEEPSTPSEESVSADASDDTDSTLADSDQGVGAP